MVQLDIYQSVLRKLSNIPIEYLTEVDVFLTILNKEIDTKAKNKENILALAGSWNDMSDEDFEDYMKNVKQVKKEMFNREIDL